MIKTTKNNFLAVCLLMALGVGVTTPTFADPVPVMFSYELDSDGNATVTGCEGSCPTSDLIIPSVIDGHPVVRIGDYAFYTNQLTSVSIPSSVTAIGDHGFAQNRLASVSIPSSVTSIGNSGFAYNELASVSIPSSITTIGDWVFHSNLLTSVSIPSSVTTIKMGAFSYNLLSSVSIPSSVTSIGAWAFQNNLLSSVSFPASVTRIEDGAFGTNQLTSVMFQGDAPVAGLGVFRYNIELDHLDVSPNTHGWGSIWSRVPVPAFASSPAPLVFTYWVDSDGDATILGCDGVCATSDLIIPSVIDGHPVVRIGYYAFYGKHLTSVSIPSSVTSIVDGAFQNNLLSSVSIPSSITTIGEYGFAQNRLASVSIPSSITTIGGWVFHNNLLTSVSISSSVTSIGPGAFQSNLLSSVSIPSSVATIGDWAFQNNLLSSVSIPASVTSIEDGAFGSNQLTSVMFQGDAPLAGVGVFRNNSALDHLDVSPNTQGWFATWSRVPVPTFASRPASLVFTYGVDNDGGATITGCNGVCVTSDLIIPPVIDGHTVVSIGCYAFNSNLLTSVSIPSSITSIGPGAFQNNLLSSVSIPSSVETIGEYGFAYNELASVSIPSSVTSIGSYVFAHNELASVSIPFSVTSIGEYGFAYNELDSVSIPSSITSIGPGAFQNNLLSSVSIPASVTSIEDGAFGSNQLTSVMFQGDAPMAGTGVFRNNSALNHLDVSPNTQGWLATWSMIPVVLPPSLPSDTVIESIHAGNGQLSVNFVAPTSNGGADITNYEYSTDNGSTWVTASLAQATSSLVIGGLVNGTTYSVKVRAVNSVGSGTASNSVSVKPCSPASAPSISGLAVANGQATVTVTAPSQINDSALSGYDYSINSGTTWSHFASGTGPLTINGLTNGATYQVKVRAVNSAGPGAASDALAVTPTNLVPSAPTIYSVTAGNQMADVSIALATGVTAQSITGYQYNINSSLTWADCVMTARSCRVVGLKNGAKTKIKVRAVNANGVSLASTKSYVTPVTTSQSPIIKTVTSSAGALTVAFSAPVDNGGSKVLRYEYSVDGGVWMSPVRRITSSPFKISGLANATSYSLRIRDVTAVGNGDASTSVSESTPYVAPVTTAQSPTINTVTSSAGALTVAFSAPVDNGGSKVLRYEYSVDGGVWMSPVRAITSSPFKISGLANATSYSVRVRAVTAVGIGEDSSSVSGSTPAVVASAPTITTVLVGKTSITVHFTAPLNNGGVAVTNYAYTVDGKTWTTSSPSSASTQIAISGLTSDKAYTVKLRAVNSAGLGSISAAQSVKTLK